MEIRTQDQLFDLRVVDRLIKKGLTSKKDYEKFLKALPDVADNAESIDVSLGGEEDAAESASEAEAGETGAGA